ncbi:MAG: hypothetical protein WC121_09965 [Candidatus Kapaibacterium sp.]
MKKIILIIASIFSLGFILILFLAYNFIGAGTVGSIETYQFKTTTDVLDSLILDIATKNNNIKFINSNDYFNSLKIDDPYPEDVKSIFLDYNYVSILVNESNYILRYNTLELDSNSSLIILFSGAKSGDYIGSQISLSNSEIRFYKDIFRKNIITQINLLLPF